LSKVSLTNDVLINQLKFGKINFINCLPIDYPMTLNPNFNGHVIEGSPTKVNQALREALIDIAPISSYEYLSNKKLYDRIPGISISSKLKADSVMFFYNQDIEPGSKIYLTDKSASSVNLLKIILNKKFYLNLEDLDFEFFAENSTDYSAKLLIGDEALKEDKSKYQKYLDLGTAWYELTQYPMVFGLWTASKKSNLSQVDIENLADFFAELRDAGLNQYLPDVIIKAYERTGINKLTLKEYFHNLDYTFTEDHEQSLILFDKYLQELGLK
jgi:chorismate dehydratase